MSRHVALLRGINVGRAKRVGMDDLRDVVAGLGYTRVRTLLNSGNVVFTSARRLGKDAAPRMEEALLRRTGVSSRVTILSGDELSALFKECPLLDVADDATRLLLAVPSTAADAARMRVLEGHDWTPEAFAVGARAAYLWCPAGVTAGRLWRSVTKELGDSVTTRNWATVTKLVAAVADE